MFRAMGFGLFSRKENSSMEGQESRGSGMLGRAAAYGIATVSILWQNATKDGHLAAAGRQGLDEIGHALKAFPESIQTQEVGAIFEPTQGEIASSRRGSVHGLGYGLRPPSQIAHGRSAVYGRDEVHGRLRSPSEIAADRGGREAETSHSNEHDHGRDMGREM
jgi:hypothetical protein